MANVIIKNRKIDPFKLIVHLFLLFFSIIFLLPFIWMLLTSFKETTEAITVPPRWLPEKFLFGNYPKLFTLFPFGAYFYNSLSSAFFRVVCALLFSSMAGYAFAKINFPGRKLLFALVLIQFMVPQQIFILPQYKMVLNLGQLNTIFALVFPGLVSMFGTFLMRQAFMTLPDELGEAAMIDGASQGRIFFRIYLPLVKPHLIALGIMTILFSWKDLLWPLVVNTQPEKMTLTAGLLYFNSAKGYISSYPLMMAGAAVATIPLVLVYFIFQRYILEGVANTGIK